MKKKIFFSKSQNFKKKLKFSTSASALEKTKSPKMMKNPPKDAPESLLSPKHNFKAMRLLEKNAQFFSRKIPQTRTLQNNHVHFKNKNKSLENENKTWTLECKRNTRILGCPLLGQLT